MKYSSVILLPLSAIESRAKSKSYNPEACRVLDSGHFYEHDSGLMWNIRDKYK
jgi:hypothetical protein